MKRSTITEYNTITEARTVVKLSKECSKESGRTLGSQSMGQIEEVKETVYSMAERFFQATSEAINEATAPSKELCAVH